MTKKKSKKYGFQTTNNSFNWFISEITYEPNVNVPWPMHNSYSWHFRHAPWKINRILVIVTSSSFFMSCKWLKNWSCEIHIGVNHDMTNIWESLCYLLIRLQLGLHLTVWLDFILWFYSDVTSTSCVVRWSSSPCINCRNISQKYLPELKRGNLHILSIGK